VTCRPAVSDNGLLDGGVTVNDHELIEKAAAAKEARDTARRRRVWSSDAEVIDAAVKRHLAAKHDREHVEKSPESGDRGTRAGA
jgi:hypothetical protein